MTAMAGDRPGYEEATRMLFAGDAAGFDAVTAAWPQDVRAFTVGFARTPDTAHPGESRDPVLS